MNGNKQHLIDELRAKHNLSLDDAKSILDTTLQAITDLTHRHEMLVIRDFGTFKLSHRKASRTRNPRTGQMIDVPASTQIRFRQRRERK